MIRRLLELAGLVKPIPQTNDQLRRAIAARYLADDAMYDAFCSEEYLEAERQVLAATLAHLDAHQSESVEDVEPGLRIAQGWTRSRRMTGPAWVPPAGIRRFS